MSSFFFFSLNVALKRHIYGNTKNHQNFFPFFFFTKDRLVNSKVFVWMRQIKPPVSQCVSWYTATTSVEKKNWCSTDCSPWGKSVFEIDLKLKLKITSHPYILAYSDNELCTTFTVSHHVAENLFIDWLIKILQIQIIKQCSSVIIFLLLFICVLHLLLGRLALL